MTAVRLNRQVTLERRNTLPDGSGGLTVVWQVLGTLWAEVLPGTGQAAADEAGKVARVPVRITVRGAPVGSARRPEPGQRFREGARCFAVLAVTEHGRDGRYLTCFAQEETPI